MYKDKNLTESCEYPPFVNKILYCYCEFLLRLDLTLNAKVLKKNKHTHVSLLCAENYKTRIVLLNLKSTK